MNLENKKKDEEKSPSILLVTIYSTYEYMWYLRIQYIIHNSVLLQKKKKNWNRVSFIFSCNTITIERVSMYDESTAPVINEQI